jgi:two-component system OmpR family response regulator
VLLLDDDEEVLDILQSRLLATGRFHVTAHRTAKGALAEIAEREPDLILSDIDMPGMDGGAFAAALRASGAGAPVIFVSSLVSASESGGTVGGWPMVAKRAPFETLLGRIDDALASRRGQGE